MFRISTLIGGLVLLTAPLAEAAPKKPAAAAKGSTAQNAAGKKPSAVDKQKSRATIEALLKSQESESEAAEAKAAPASYESVRTVKVSAKDTKAAAARKKAIESNEKILQKEMNQRDADPDEIAERLFRLAEAWTEEAEFLLNSQEMPAHQKAMEEWQQCRQKNGDKSCSGEPRPNHDRSSAARQNAYGYYKKIISGYPKYSRRDEVLFNLASNRYDNAVLLEQKSAQDKQKKEGAEIFQQMLKEYPKSKSAQTAYVRLGNFYFDTNDVMKARQAYESAIKTEDPANQTYATYKLAWCDVNQGDHESARDRFMEVVKRSMDKKKGDKTDLRKEALRDLVKPLIELDERTKAVDFYVKYAGNDAFKYLKRLADGQKEAGGARTESALWMYRYMIEQRPNDKNAPEWQTSVIQVLDRKGKRDEVRNEVTRLVETYGAGSRWYQANESDKAALRIALGLAEESLYSMVTDYHQEAIKTKVKDTYELARDIYRKFLESFPESTRSYSMRFYYAEILYALEDYQSAYEQYVKVAGQKPPSDADGQDFRKVSATNMLLAAEKMVDIEAGRYKKQEGGSIDENKAKGDMAKAEVHKTKVEKNSAEQVLTEVEKQLVAACDKYLEIVPDAEDEAKVRLRSAIIFFDKGNYVEAGNRFSYIIKKWPSEKSSATAATLVLESLEVKEQWADLNRIAKEFLENKKLLEGKDKEEFRKKLEGTYIQGSQFKLAEGAEKENQTAKAIELFAAFMTDYPKSRYTPIAAAKVFYIHRKAQKLDLAIKSGEQLITDYKDCDSGDWLTLPSGEKRTAKILPDVMWELALSYQESGDFMTAAARLDRYANDYKDTAKGPVALLNAAVLYEGLGEADKATRLYNRYIEVYREREKSKRTEELTKEGLPKPVEVALQPGLMAETAGNPVEVINQLRKYLTDYKGVLTPSQTILARYKQYKAALQLKAPDLLKVNLRDPSVLCDEIQKSYASAPEADKDKDSSREAAAHCAFVRLEPQFTAYRDLTFKNFNNFQADYNKKKKMFDDLAGAYAKILAFQNDDWFLASTIRIADMARLFGNALQNAAAPKGLDEDQIGMYRSSLEERAQAEWEEPAITKLEEALTQAFKAKVYNEWTLKAEDMMAEYPSQKDRFGEIKNLPLRPADTFFTVSTSN